MPGCRRYIIIIILLWGLISFPLCLVGTVIGRNWNSIPDFPCRCALRCALWRSRHPVPPCTHTRTRRAGVPTAAAPARPPRRVKRIPSPIPESVWYLRPWAIMMAGGLLPFGSIFIEMYFIFTSFWNYKVCGAGGGAPDARALLSSPAMWAHQPHVPP